MNKKENRWQDQDVEFLKQNYGLLTLEVIADHLKRSLCSVEKRANRLRESGLLSNKKETWSKEQIHNLKEYYSKMSISDLKSITGKNERQIHQKAYNLGITKARYSVANYRGGGKKQKKTISSAVIKHKRVAKHVERRNRPLVIKPFSTEGKKRIAITNRTSIYVPVSATQKEIEAIVNRYKNTV